MSRLVFFDTSAFIALENRTDSEHEAAIATRDRLLAGGARPVTTTYCLDETYTFFRRSFDARSRILKAIRESPLVLYESVKDEDERRAVELAMRLKDKDFSFTDLTSFAVIERLGIRVVFTFDDDFRQFGRWKVTPDR